MPHRRVCALREVVDAHTLLVQWNDRPQLLRLMDVAPESGSAAAGRTPTQFGRQTLRWATEDFFKGVRDVQIESPDDHWLSSNSGSQLGYAIVRGENYNVRLVREGFSPCFEKYGHPTTYRCEMEKAEQWARREGLGLWGSPVREQYRSRKQWWLLRAGQVEGFRHAVDMGDDIFDCRAHYKEVVRHAKTGAKAAVFADVVGRFDLADGATLLQLGSPRQPLCAYFPPTLQGLSSFISEEYIGIGKPNYLYFDAVLSMEGNQPQFNIATPDQITTYPPRTRP